MGHEVAAVRAFTMGSETLAMALDAAEVGAWDWDLISGELIFSDTLERIFRLEPGSFDRTIEGFNALVHPDDQRRVANAIDQARFEGIPYDTEYVICPSGEGRRWIAAKGQLVSSANGQPVRMLGVAWDITARKTAEIQLANRTRQQGVVAELGRRAVTTSDLGALLDVATEAVAETLGAEFVQVLELLPEGGALVLRAGVGWRAGLVGQATVGAGTNSQAGYTLLNDEPVIVDDLRLETRFNGPPLLHEHGVVSGLCTIIRGQDRPYGVLGAHTVVRRTFTQDDAHFLRSVANILAAAIQREQGEAARREEYLRVLVEHGTDIVSLVDADGVRRYVSPVVKTVLGYEPEELVESKPPGTLVHPDDMDRQLQLLADVRREPERARCVEIRVRHKNGSWRYLEMTASNRLDDPMVGGIILTSRDVTERKEAEATLRAERDLLQAVIDNLPDPIYVKDTDSRFLRANRATAASVGHHNSDEIVGKTDFDMFPAELAERFRAEELHLFETGQPILDRLEEQSLDTDSQRWLRTSKAPLVDQLGNIAGLVGSARDVTEQIREQAARQQERIFLDAVLENAADGIVACDASGTLTLFNRATLEFHALSETPLPPEQWAEHYSLYRPDGETLLPTEEIPLVRALHGEAVRDAEMMIVPKHGTPRTVVVSGKPLVDAAGSTLGAMAVMHDVTEQRRAERDREQALVAWQQSFDALPDHLCILDRSGTILQANRSMRARFEPIRGPLVGLDYRLCYLGTATPEVQPPCAAVLSGGPAVSLEMALPTMEGWFLVSSYPIDVDGERRGAVSVVHDLTERKALEERLVHEALHDALTGLPNRTLLRDRLAHALSVASRRGEQLAVLFIDLDRFKVVNDSLGHALGDAILMAIAHRLSHHMRESDTLARFGGDEFVALIEGFSSIDEVQAIARRLQASLRDPFTVMGEDAFVAASMGIAVGSPGHDRADDLLREADLAMYRAKAAGRGEVLLFEPAMSDEARERMALEMDIRKAVEQGELRLHYQPQVDLRNGQVVGVEALVRWQHPNRGLVAPTEFIPLIEDTQLIAPVGQWVLREACRQARDWRHERPNAAVVPVHVNISAREFQSPNSINQITSLLAEMELPAGSLGLEITEGILIEDSAAALTTLQELKRLGVLVAIDDFGTGYSSLAYLSRLPVDMLKIDRSFVSGIDKNEGQRAIVKAVSDLGRAFGMVVMAEGIERQEEAALVRSLGVQGAQGYFFSRPVPASELAGWLQQRQRDTRSDQQQERRSALGTVPKE